MAINKNAVMTLKYKKKLLHLKRIGVKMTVQRDVIVNYATPLYAPYGVINYVMLSK